MSDPIHQLYAGFGGRRRRLVHAIARGRRALKSSPQEPTMIRIYCDHQCGRYLSTHTPDQAPSTWTCPECELHDKDIWVQQQEELARAKTGGDE